MLRRLPAGCAVLIATCLIALASAAVAQPFIPAAGEGTVSVAYHWIVTHGQHDTVGTQLAASGGPRDGTDSNVFLSFVEYGLNDRIAVHASIPYIRTRYQGMFPHQVGLKGQPSNLDDGNYHGSFQDFYFGARFKLFESARFAVTPFVETIIPSHHYESLGQAAVGRDLRALVVGTAVGGFADYVIPGLHFQTRLSYAFSEKAVDIRPNRMGIDSAVGYFVTPRLGIEFIETFQYTFDGVDWVGPPDFLRLHDGRPLNRDYGLNHDRLARSNALSLGVGVSFALTEKLGIFGTFTRLAWGANLPAPRSVTVGMNIGYQTRAASGLRPNINRALWPE